MTHLPRATALAFLVAFPLAAGCNNSPPPECTPGTASGEAAGCMAGQVCERVTGGHPTCFAPVRIGGRVIDALDTSPIEGARVLALDANGAAISTVVLTAADGTYTLPVPAERDAMGVPSSADVTLRVDASGYQTFPTAPRSALPIDLASGTTTDGNYVVRSAATDVALLPITGGSGITLRGNVVATDAAGVLVIAEQGGVAVASGVSDTEGDFALFDVPAGMTHVAGYRAELLVTPVDVMAAAPGVDGIVLDGTTGMLSTVSGSVNLVNAPGASTTSVILVVESTFVESAARGEAPAGLRAGDVTNAFSIPNVPPGTYVVLAAFENDGLVRDPDMAIGGTAIQHVTVPPGGAPVMLDQSFKVTGALDVVSPGADGTEVITSGTPMLTWADDSSEDGYELRVFDAFGSMVWEDLAVPSHSGSGDVSVGYGGPALMAGMIYQFRATSWRTGHGTAPRTYISATEDLRGTFEYRP